MCAVSRPARAFWWSSDLRTTLASSSDLVCRPARPWMSPTLPARPQAAQRVGQRKPPPLWPDNGGPPRKRFPAAPCSWLTALRWDRVVPKTAQLQRRSTVGLPLGGRHFWSRRAYELLRGFRSAQSRSGVCPEPDCKGHTWEDV